VNNFPGKIKRRERKMAKEKDFFDDDSDLFNNCPLFPQGERK